MSTELPLKQKLWKKVRLAKRFVIIIISFTLKSTIGLIVTSTILVGLLLSNKPKSHRIFSIICMLRATHLRKLLISNFVLNVTDSLPIDSSEVSVLCATIMMRKATNAMAVEN